MIEIREFKQAHSSNYTKGRRQKITHIVIHYVGALGSALNNLKYFEGPDRKASAHYFIDHGPYAMVYQSVKEQDMAWHAGDNSMNQKSIGLELCCHKDSKGNWYFDKETVDTTIELVKELMEKHNISINNVIRHYDVTGKNCPAPWVEDESKWVEFKEKLIEKEDKQEVEQVIYNKIEEIPVWYRQAVKKLVDKGVLTGNSSGDLGLSEEMCRIFTVHDRLGLYDR